MTARSAGQISAFERLRELPALFRGGDLTRRFGWSSKSASQYVYLWGRRGLVQALGGHSDVYANLLASRHPDWERALVMAMPSAVLVGIEAMRRAGWTTQVPQRPTVAVKAGHALFKTDHFDVVTRTPRWFDRIAAGIAGHAAQDLRALRPTWALADQLEAWGWEHGGLSPDDLEWSHISKADERDWRAACEALQLPRISLRQMAVPARDHQPRNVPERLSTRSPRHPCASARRSNKHDSSRRTGSPRSRSRRT
ncbi:MAG: hypothetical protein ACRETZ_00920 [Steroidobacteraceae bacterium]